MAIFRIEKVVDPGAGDGTRPTNDAEYLVAFVEQQFCKKGSVLTRDTCDERFLHKNQSHYN
jgi:hypothetical protein